MSLEVQQASKSIDLNDQGLFTYLDPVLLRHMLHEVLQASLEPSGRDVYRSLSHVGFQIETEEVLYLD